MAMATTTYEMEAMIRGYHVYVTVWDAQIGEELYCARLQQVGYSNQEAVNHGTGDQLVKGTSVET